MRWTGAWSGWDWGGKAGSGAALLKAPMAARGKPWLGLRPGGARPPARKVDDYFFLAAWTSISASILGATRLATCMVTRAGLLGCSGVPKNIL